MTSVQLHPYHNARIRVLARPEVSRIWCPNWLGLLLNTAFTFSIFLRLERTYLHNYVELHSIESTYLQSQLNST